MKPFIRGKILFSPDTPSTRRIMAAVNATFSPIEGVRRMTRKWIEVYSERVRGLFLDKENQEFMKVTIPICVSLVYRVGLSICRKVLQIMFWEVPPAEWPIL